MPRDYPTRPDPTQREVAIARRVVRRLVEIAGASDKRVRKTRQRGRGTRVLKEVARQLLVAIDDGTSCVAPLSDERTNK